MALNLRGTMTSSSSPTFLLKRPEYDPSHVVHHFFIRALPDHALSRPILVYVEEVPEGYMALDNVVGRHGVGSTPQEAVDDLAEVLQEIFLFLGRREARLAPRLQRELELLREIIAA